MRPLFNISLASVSLFPSLSLTRLAPNSTSVCDPLNLAIAATITAAAALAMPAYAGNIYKVVDAETGKVTFTDRPEGYQQDSGKQVIDTHVQTVSPYPNSSATAAVNNSMNNGSMSDSSAGSLTLQSGQPPALPSMNTQPVSEAADYRFSIISPDNEQVFRRPAQSIEVQLSLTPALKAGDTVRISIDGQEVAQGVTASLPTVDILPGEHVIKAELLNNQGKTLAQASRTIYLLQTTQLLQQKKQLAKQLKAYQDLPWHQKLLLKLRQDKLPASAIIPPTVEQVTGNINNGNLNKNQANSSNNK